MRKKVTRVSQDVEKPDLSAEGSKSRQAYERVQPLWSKDGQFLRKLTWNRTSLPGENTHPSLTAAHFTRARVGDPPVMEKKAVLHPYSGTVFSREEERVLTHATSPEDTMRRERSQLGGWGARGRGALGSPTTLWS